MGGETDVPWLSVACAVGGGCAQSVDGVRPFNSQLKAHSSKLLHRTGHVLLYEGGEDGGEPGDVAENDDGR